MATSEGYCRENCPPRDDLTVEFPFSRRFFPAEQKRLKRLLTPESQDDHKWVETPGPEGIDLHRAFSRKHIFRVLLRNEGDDWVAERLLVAADAPFDRYRREDWAVTLVQHILDHWIASPEM